MTREGASSGQVARYFLVPEHRIPTSIILRLSLALRTCWRTWKLSIFPGREDAMRLDVYPSHLPSARPRVQALERARVQAPRRARVPALGRARVQPLNRARVVTLHYLNFIKPCYDKIIAKSDQGLVCRRAFKRMRRAFILSFNSFVCKTCKTIKFPKGSGAG